MSASVHVWGFFNEDGSHRMPNGAAPSDLSVYHHHRQVEANVTRHGGLLTALRTTRNLDGLLMATEFETPAHEGAARFWHMVVRPSAEWPRPKATEEQA